MNTFPIYLLQLGETIQVVFPEGKVDLGHSEFWEATVSGILAKHYKIPVVKLANLPYCQRRARVVGDKCYYGETQDSALLKEIRQAVGNTRLAFSPDEHEKRLKADVLEFRRLVRRYLPKSTMT